jgi:hypothetical protein
MHGDAVAVTAAVWGAVALASVAAPIINAETTPTIFSRLSQKLCRIQQLQRMNHRSDKLANVYDVAGD